jgi:hypothetical protein
MVKISGIVAAAAVLAMIFACFAVPAANAGLTGDVKKVAVEIGLASGDKVSVGFNYNTETMTFDVMGMNWKVRDYQMTGNVMVTVESQNPPELTIVDDSGAAVFTHVRGFVLKMPDGTPALSCAMAKTNVPSVNSLIDCFPTLGPDAIMPFTAYEWEVWTVSPMPGAGQICQVRSNPLNTDASADWEINAFVQDPVALISEHLGDFHLDAIRPDGVMALSIIPGYGSEPWMAAIQNTRSEDNWEIITGDGFITVPQMSDAYTMEIFYSPIPDPLADRNTEIHVHVGRMDLKSEDTWQVIFGHRNNGVAINDVVIIGYPLMDDNWEIIINGELSIVPFVVEAWNINYIRDGEFHLDGIGVDGSSDTWNFEKAWPVRW